MKAIVNTQYKALKGIFDKGDKVKIEIIRHKEDVLIHDDIYAVFKQDKKDYHITSSRAKDSVKIFDKLVAEKGTMKSWRIKSKNGKTYSEASFLAIIGYKSLGEIFARVN